MKCKLCRWNANSADEMQTLQIKCKLCRSNANSADQMQTLQIKCKLCRWICTQMHPSFFQIFTTLSTSTMSLFTKKVLNCNCNSNLKWTIFFEEDERVQLGLRFLKYIEALPHCFHRFVRNWFPCGAIKRKFPWSYQAKISVVQTVHNLPWSYQT